MRTYALGAIAVLCAGAIGLAVVSRREPAAPAVDSPPAQAQSPKAVEAVEKPIEPATRKFLAEASTQLQARRYPEAKALLETCLRANPSDAECHRALGLIVAKLGDTERGAFALREFMRLAPPDHPDREKVKTILDEFDANRR